MIKFLIIVFIIIMVVIIYLSRENNRLFNKHYYKFVYNFNHDHFDLLDKEGKTDYYILLIEMRDSVRPTKKKSTFNNKIQDTSKIISYIERNYKDIC